MQGSCPPGRGSAHGSSYFGLLLKHCARQAAWRAFKLRYTSASCCMNATCFKGSVQLESHSLFACNIVQCRLSKRLKDDTGSD